MSKQRWEGYVFEGWKVCQSLGSGGNGVVHQAMRGEQAGAIKILKPSLWTGKRYERFKDEIEGMKRCEDILGVVPLLDSNTPKQPTDEDPPWIVMGLAEPLTKALESASLTQIVQACLEIAEALSAMHAIGLSHRDIKPENLFRFQDRWAVGDLGLVDKDREFANSLSLLCNLFIPLSSKQNSSTQDSILTTIPGAFRSLGVSFPLVGKA
jgi:serine/threonine protein kinase